MLSARRCPVAKECARVAGIAIPRLVQPLPATHVHGRSNAGGTLPTHSVRLPQAQIRASLPLGTRFALRSSAGKASRRSRRDSSTRNRLARRRQTSTHRHAEASGVAKMLPTTWRYPYALVPSESRRKSSTTSSPGSSSPMNLPNYPTAALIGWENSPNTFHTKVSGLLHIPLPHSRPGVITRARVDTHLGNHYLLVRSSSWRLITPRLSRQFYGQSHWAEHHPC